MQRRTSISLGIGIFSVACASGALMSGRPAPPVFTVEPLEGQGASVLRGRVSSPDDGAAAGAAIVVLQCECLEDTREMQTNSDGLYSFHELPPGTYTVQALFGAANSTRQFRIDRPSLVRVDFQLDGSGATVTVT